MRDEPISKPVEGPIALWSATEPYEPVEGGYADGTPEGWLPEYWHNPFIRPLGSPFGGDELLTKLEVHPNHSPHERRLSHTLRRNCLLRLFDLIVPLERHVQFAERLGMIIRQGYKARNPALGLHRSAFLASASAIEGLNAGDLTIDQALEMMPTITHSQAVGFALLGDPGMSKTTTTNRALSVYTQVVEPETPYYVKQIVWLKVECPSMGGRKQLCAAILSAIDKVIGTRYAARFGLESKRRTGDEMMAYVQHLVNLHAIGLIAVDELQHAMQSSEGVKPLMNFLVTLVNMLGVPIVLIGTNEARPIIDSAFREARRASGLGQPNWFRMEREEEWDEWLDEVWRYQWTQIDNPITPELSEALYDECQGIIDIAIKLFVVAQMYAIDRNEYEGRPEVIDAELIRKVANEQFKLIAPMIKALRDGRPEILATYSDLQPIHDHVERLMCQSTGRTIKELKTLRDLRDRIADAKAEARDAPWIPIKASILQRGYPVEVADRVIAEAMQSSAVDDLLGMMEAVQDLLTKEQPPRKPTPPKSKANAKAKKDRAPAPDGSLRRTVEDGCDAHEALMASGDVVSVADLLK